MAWSLFGNDEPLVDKGFELMYYRLSHRRRFWRVVWIAPFYVGILHSEGARRPAAEHYWRFELAAIGLLVAGAIYEYWQWQMEKGR